MRKLLLTIIVFCQFSAGADTLPAVTTELGQIVTLENPENKAKQQVYIKLPVGYADSKKPYPVIYLLDADLFYMDKIFFPSVALPSCAASPNCSRLDELSVS